MNIILLKSVRSLGKAGDLVSVKNGYANNFLIPQGIAVYASNESKEFFSSKKDDLMKQDKILMDAANIIKEKLEGQEFIIEVMADKKSGSLYAALYAGDIADVINKKYNFNIDKSNIITSSIKSVGEYSIELYPHPEVSFSIVIKVVAINI